MTLTCVVVEDEPLARNLLEQYILKVSHLQLVKSFANPLAALDFLRNNSVDILFSDIQMPEITGISLLKILPKKPLVILTTAYSEYAIEGYELDVLDYLLKPITLERFLKAVEKATQRLSAAPSLPASETLMPADPVQASIFVKDGTKLVKIRLNEILYIEGLKDYVAIYTKDKKVVTLQTLKSLEVQLTPHQFLRVHNSYIVSFEAIDSIDKEKIQIGKVWIPISDTYRKTVKEFIERTQS
ncbi:LytR/AlgR family response regulator transcription factor [Runella slithyformis]|uniref:Two component transcriptional regulator, LytTR family n=1 Tax=Runella slithyformis (strain ATCC 29530 / DSM 19594 / LMG 11500 / NCIMB 11436 / LSU 4) TaxID=761193 RepID=A0A7U4E5V9_RUNSL|nr:LytTR family DNA-binding domain-containing protein [Runella slithyformis]AEI48714.1 two component transcriptional regulator, LytTR family [Runella slithyformis DSM 19594]